MDSSNLVRHWLGRTSAFSSLPSSRQKKVLGGVIKCDVLPRIQPMRLEPVREAFDDADFIFEMKHDGLKRDSR